MSSLSRDLSEKYCIEQQRMIKPYKNGKVQKLSERNIEIRNTFSFWYEARGRDFHGPVLWLNKKWWVLDADGNFHNTRTRAPVNPHEIEETKGKRK